MTDRYEATECRQAVKKATRLCYDDKEQGVCTGGHPCLTPELLARYAMQRCHRSSGAPYISGTFRAKPYTIQKIRILTDV
jgi:hypothetical protein